MPVGPEKPFTVGEETFRTFESFLAAVSLPPGDSVRQELADATAEEARQWRKQHGVTQAYWNGTSFPARTPKFSELIKMGRSRHAEAQGYPVGFRYRTANVISSSPRWAALSNFAPAPFALGGLQFGSVEGFIQALKFEPTDTRREHIATLVGRSAKAAARERTREIAALLRDGIPVAVEWNSERTPYRSERHLEIIFEGMRAKFQQNPEIAALLASTEERVILHRTGRPEKKDSSLPNQWFCAMLTTLRDHGLAAPFSTAKMLAYKDSSAS